MSSAAIAYGNLADTCTLSGGSWNSTYPLNNLKTRLISVVARSTNALAASTTFTAALLASSPIGALSLEGTNASVNAQVRWRTYSDAGLTALIYDSGLLDIYPDGTMAFGSVHYGAANWWTARPLPADLARFQRGMRHIATTKAAAQYIKCEIVDTANPDGYFQAGRLFVGDVFQPGAGLNYGAAMQLKPLSQVTRSLSGAKQFIKRRPMFTMPVVFGQLTEAEAMRVLDLQAQVDVTGEVILVWDPADKAFRFRKSLYGELAQLDPLQYPTATSRSMAFQIEGVL